MSGTIWSKFFWSDWETDQALKLCSFAAQGLWMRMLCIAASHDPVGLVAVAGRPLDSSDIARMTGGRESEVDHLLAELDRNGVFSRDRKSRIYSRRMVADAKKADLARANGKKGGNPKLGKDKGNPASDNPPVKGGVGSGVKPHKPEARVQKIGSVSNETADKPPKEASQGDQLGELRGLPLAKGCWRIALKVLTERGKITDAKARALIGKLKGAGLTDADLWAIAEDAWLNGTLDPAPYLIAAAERIAFRKGSGDIVAPSEARQRAWAADWLEFGPGRWRTYERGPKPGDPGCRISPAILEEFGIGVPAKKRA